MVAKDGRNDNSSSPTNRRFNAALRYAQHGWQVLRLWWVKDGGCACGEADCPHIGKHPVGRLVHHGHTDATVDQEMIQQWWNQCPEANIGISTGAKSGFFVLDVDPRHGGEESLDQLEAEHGKLPETVEQLTGGGGRHICFKHLGRRVPTRKGVWPGIDMKGDGGYIVAEPSNHFSGGRYAWELSCHPDTVRLAEAPEWLMKVLVEHREPRQKNDDGRVEPFRFDPSGAQEVAIAKGALAAIKPERADDYDCWTKVGMILRTVDPGPAMLDMWDKWSAQSNKYKPGECAKKWSSFNPNGELCLPTLVRWAQLDSGGDFKVDGVAPAVAAQKTSSEQQLRISDFDPSPSNRCHSRCVTSSRLLPRRSATLAASC